MDAYYDKHPEYNVQHKHYDVGTGVLSGNEHKVVDIGVRGTKIDGWIKETKTVLEFHGDYWHGNPDKYDPTDWNVTTKCTFGELYDNTLERMDNLVALGYRVVYIWEGDFRKWEKAGLFEALPCHVHGGSDGAQ